MGEVCKNIVQKKAKITTEKHKNGNKYKLIPITEHKIRKEFRCLKKQGKDETYV